MGGLTGSGAAERFGVVYVSEPRRGAPAPALVLVRSDVGRPAPQLLVFVVEVIGVDDHARWVRQNQRIVSHVGVEAQLLRVDHVRRCDRDGIRAEETSHRRRIAPGAEVVIA